MFLVQQKCLQLDQDFKKIVSIRDCSASRNFFLKNDVLYRVSRKTLYAFYFAITQLMMHRAFSSWTFSNSPFRWLLEIVQNFKD